VAAQAVRERRLHPAAAIVLGFIFCLAAGGVVYAMVTHYIGKLPGYGYALLIPSLFFIGIPLGYLSFRVGIWPQDFFVDVIIAAFIWFCGTMLLGMPEHVASIAGLVAMATAWGAILGGALAIVYETLKLLFKLLPKQQ
jgi:vacuolar-type H+-ATPase subunit I/STV1